MIRAKLKQKQSNQLRIIGGEWRGRKLDFPAIQSLRPTSDRIRETLFNWLQFDVIGAHCLDLFAGSGALGFEALSRGAASITFVDEHPKAISQIKSNAEILKTDSVHCIQADAFSFLQSHGDSSKYDIVFLDPPFQKEFLPKILAALSTENIFKSDSLIYIEMEKQLTLQDLPKNWQLKKEKTAGQVRYMLFQIG